MTTITVETSKISSDEIYDKIYKKFRNDGMEYNLILVSDIICISNEFSNNYPKEQYISDKKSFPQSK